MLLAIVLAASVGLLLLNTGDDGAATAAPTTAEKETADDKPVGGTRCSASSVELRRAGHYAVEIARLTSGGPAEASRLVGELRLEPSLESSGWIGEEEEEKEKEKEKEELLVAGEKREKRDGARHHSYAWGRPNALTDRSYYFGDGEASADEEKVGGSQAPLFLPRRSSCWRCKDDEDKENSPPVLLEGLIASLGAAYPLPTDVAEELLQSTKMQRSQQPQSVGRRLRRVCGGSALGFDEGRGLKGAAASTPPEGIFVVQHRGQRLFVCEPVGTSTSTTTGTGTSSGTKVYSVAILGADFDLLARRTQVDGLEGGSDADTAGSIADRLHDLESRCDSLSSETGERRRDWAEDNAAEGCWFDRFVRETKNLAYDDGGDDGDSADEDEDEDEATVPPALEEESMWWDFDPEPQWFDSYDDQLFLDHNDDRGGSHDDDRGGGGRGENDDGNSNNNNNNNNQHSDHRRHEHDDRGG